jgi:hypothetical protein
MGEKGREEGTNQYMNANQSSGEIPKGKRQ